MQAQSQIAHLENSSQFFCVLIIVFFFIKKNNLQVGVSGWRGGGGRFERVWLYMYMNTTMLANAFCSISDLEGIEKKV